MFSSMMLSLYHESAILYLVYKAYQGKDSGKGSNGHGPGNAYVHVACKEKSQEKYMMVMMAAAMQAMASMAGFSRYVTRKKMAERYPAAPAADRTLSW